MLSWHALTYLGCVSGTVCSLLNITRAISDLQVASLFFSLFLLAEA